MRLSLALPRVYSYAHRTIIPPLARRLRPRSRLHLDHRLSVSKRPLTSTLARAYTTPSSEHGSISKRSRTNATKRSRVAVVRIPEKQYRLSVVPRPIYPPPRTRFTRPAITRRICRIRPARESAAHRTHFTGVTLGARALYAVDKEQSAPVFITVIFMEATPVTLMRNS